MSWGKDKEQEAGSQGQIESDEDLLRTSPTMDCWQPTHDCFAVCKLIPYLSFPQLQPLRVCIWQSK